MSRICEICGKTPRSGHNVSHSKRRTKRRYLPNIFVRRVDGEQTKFCAACWRTTKKPARAKKPTAVAAAA